MKIRLLNAGLCACALLMTLSGCSSDETLTGDNSTATQSMKINVSDGMFTSVDNNGAKTRATDSGTETTFTSGDAIGIFVVESDGTLALTNAKYTYNGTSWLNSNSTTDVPYYADAKYFAYYPYQESLVSDKYDATKSTTAETFFGTLIRDWTPAADQSTQANYTTQDLMVSMATVDATTHAASFAMAHQMSMIEIDFPQVHYTYNGADVYRFTFDATNKPYNIADGKYRFLVNPSAALSITGKNQYNSTDATMTKGWKISGAAPAASKYKIYKYNGASASLTQNTSLNVCVGDATIGNYLYADGTTGTTTAGKTIVGIVFSNRLSSAEYNAGYTHGYALALRDAIPGTTSWGPIGDDAGLTKVTTFADYYNDINSGYNGTFTKGYDKNNSSYPAWKAANNYNVSVAGKNSGWYLPSIGQWWDVYANLGKVDLTSIQTSTAPVDYGLFNTGSTAVTTNVNKAIVAAGGTELTTDYYWSASEHNAYFAAVVNFDSSDFGLTFYKGYATSYVRAVLAF